jgi:hypothetical protein
MNSNLQNKYPALECALAMSKAEGNLKFLAEAEMQTMTQGEAVLDALHAIQKARKEYNKILQELSLARDGLYE